MVRFDWAATIKGYPPHELGARRVVACSHMPTHDALRFARSAGLSKGWMLASEPQPQLEGVPEGETVAVDLEHLFDRGRIAYTEGVVSGSVVYAMAPEGEPPGDRDLVTWAEERGVAWVRVVDNEVAYWGDVDRDLSRDLLRWFCAQHPINLPWYETAFEEELEEALHHGLFEHGWTRNVTLADGNRRRQLDLWGGVHTQSMVEHQAQHLLSAVQHGIRLTWRDDRWEGAVIDDRACPLNDQTGRVVQPAPR